MAKAQRPPFVLARPADMAGCGFHRMLRPLELLSRHGYVSGRAESGHIQDHILAAIHPDVVIFQRQLDATQFGDMARFRRILPNAFFIYELDDILSAIPEASYHRPYMTPGVDEKVAAGVSLCNAVTVSTQDLADHIRSIAPSMEDVRVVPNYLGADDLERIDALRIQNKNPLPPASKLRVGWGGGIGHAGDLAMLNDVFLALKDEVEWLFIGMNPDLPPGVHKTYLGATIPQYYLLSLAAMQADLIIAPLEDNLFNRCKSNLRIIEAGACSYPVIASPIAPYRTKHPPIEYATSSAEWIQKIRAFAKMPREERARHGSVLREWTERHFILDHHLEARAKAWLPSDVKPFKPDLRAQGFGTTIVSEQPIEGVETVTSLASACENTSTDVVYVRPGAVVSKDQIRRLVQSPGDIVGTVTNDGGPWGFPTVNAFTPIESNAAALIDSICAKSAPASLIEVAAVSGPLVLIRHRVIAAIGTPPLVELSPEIALLEFSSAARARGFTIGITPTVFTHSLRPFPVQPGEGEMAALRIGGRWPQGVTKDGELREMRQTIELRFHAESYKNIPLQNQQDYASWVELCDTRGPRSVASAEEWSCKANSGLIVSTIPYTDGSFDFAIPSPSDFADFCVFHPEGSRIPADAHAFFLETFLKHPDATVFYADHDFLDAKGKRTAPDFKPNFDLHLALSRDYLSQIVAIKAGLVDLSDPRPAEVVLYETVLKEALLDPKRIVHIPRILASLPERFLNPTGKFANSKLEIANAFNPNRHTTLVKHPGFTSFREFTHTLSTLAPFLSDSPAHELPSVAIIIPTKNNREMLQPCIQTIERFTSYPNFHIYVVDNGADSPSMLEYLAELASHPKITLLKHHVPYNWSELNNWAVREIESTDGPPDFFLFLNDDTRVMSPDWIEHMVAFGLDPSVGSVGARLLYPHGTVQHVGVVARHGVNGHYHKGMPANLPGVNGIAILTHEATAVTGACMLVRREVFSSLGGFNERFSDNFNDVAFCREVLSHGLVNVVAIKAELQHIEGATRVTAITSEGLEKLRVEATLLGDLYPLDDPYWNPNLLLAAFQGGAMVTGMDMASYVNAVDLPPPPWPVPDRLAVLLLGPHSAIEFRTPRRRNHLPARLLRLDRAHRRSAARQLRPLGHARTRQPRRRFNPALDRPDHRYLHQRGSARNPSDAQAPRPARHLSSGRRSSRMSASQPYPWRAARLLRPWLPPPRRMRVLPLPPRQPPRPCRSPPLAHGVGPFSFLPDHDRHLVRRDFVTNRTSSLMSSADRQTRRLSPTLPPLLSPTSPQPSSTELPSKLRHKAAMALAAAERSTRGCLPDTLSLPAPKALPPQKMREFPFLDHYDYSFTDSECSCAICVEWRLNLAELQRLQLSTKGHHKHHYGRCGCKDCESKMRARSAYLAALSRRDLYSESSFHAAHMQPDVGEKFMGWLLGVLLDRKLKSNGWWENTAPMVPLGQWQVMFHRAEAAGVLRARFLKRLRIGPFASSLLHSPSHDHARRPERFQLRCCRGLPGDRQSQRGRRRPPQDRSRSLGRRRRRRRRRNRAKSSPRTPPRPSSSMA